MNDMNDMNDINQTLGGFSEFEDDSRDKLVPGTVLGGDYELVRQLGRGGMGVVWEAKELAADRLVALKFVPRDLQRFEAEMQRVRQTFNKIHALQHQHICPLYGLKNDPQLGYYLVMKWLTGMSLDAYLMQYASENKGLSPQQVLAILKPVATALDYAHSQKIIHRDIKPSNIFLVPDDTPDKPDNIRDVQVIDFGLAGEIKASMSRVSQIEINTSGTRPYMAPEQWRGRQQSAATDQYALAVVAYEMLSGHLPFEGGDLEMLRMAVMQDKPEPIRTISPNANAVLQKGLAKDSADRFADCASFLNALAAALTPGQAKTAPSPQPQPGNRVAAQVIPDQQAQSNHSTPAKPRIVGAGSRNKTVAGVLALFLGTWGAHKFYHGSWGWGLVYLGATFFISFMLIGAIGMMINDDNRQNYSYHVPPVEYSWPDDDFQNEYSTQKSDEAWEQFGPYTSHAPATMESDPDVPSGLSVLVFTLLFLSGPYCILLLVEAILYWCMDENKYDVKYNKTPPHPFKW
jgi:serine/threonine-protein kinase